jgi:hypothetical protein
MNYYLDTEFLEGTQAKRFLGLPCGNTKPTIDLISIGIVSEDNREYYAISKDFNLKEAWNRYDIKEGVTKPKYIWDSKIKEDEKVYWIRENVLKPIWEDLVQKETDKILRICQTSLKYNLNLEYKVPLFISDFSYKSLKYLINVYGKTNQQIAEEVKKFVYNQDDEDKYNNTYKSQPKFHGYYADFDWVVFAWLFGKMIDLPTGFPMFCIDLKQELDNKALLYFKDKTLEQNISYMKNRNDYPKQTNEHNALSDAHFCRDLYKFLQAI